MFEICFYSILNAWLVLMKMNDGFVMLDVCWSWWCVQFVFLGNFIFTIWWGWWRYTVRINPNFHFPEFPVHVRCMSLALFYSHAPIKTFPSSYQSVAFHLNFTEITTVPRLVLFNGLIHIMSQYLFHFDP